MKSWLESKCGKIIMRLIVSVLAIAFVVWGISRGEMQVVLGKATTICMQCIGLG